MRTVPKMQNWGYSSPSALVIKSVTYKGKVNNNIQCVGIESSQSFSHDSISAITAGPH